MLQFAYRDLDMLQRDLITALPAQDMNPRSPTYETDMVTTAWYRIFLDDV
jgi:hypothetical protein